MDREKHWQGVYRSKSADQVSWYAPHLDRSLAMIQALADPVSEIIDVGGGASTLADDLLKSGYTKVSVLDVSSDSLEIAKRRLGSRAEAITWIVADITQTRLPPERYDVWHDRAVFHFLTDAADRRAYAELAKSSLKRGGHLIIAAFSLEGPTRCSGLDVVRYSAETLQRELGPEFVLEQELHESHLTPTGAAQKFVWCSFQKS
ncbi:MAG: class I SAM-dependent methyltransferase [bacterium]